MNESNNPRKPMASDTSVIRWALCFTGHLHADWLTETTRPGTRFQLSQLGRS